jgi:hypothetical protein
VALICGEFSRTVAVTLLICIPEAYAVLPKTDLSNLARDDWGEVSSLVLMLRVASSCRGDVSGYPASETFEYTRVPETHGSKIERGYDRVQHSRRHFESVPRFSFTYGSGAGARSRSLLQKVQSTFLESRASQEYLIVLYIQIRLDA